MQSSGGLASLMSIVDAYAHCGISKYLPVGDVLAAMEAAGVEQAVLCQHLGEYDNGYLADVVGQYPGRFAGVCLVNPDLPEGIGQLRKWHATGRFRGLRTLAEWLPRNPALFLEAADLGMNLVVYAPEGIASAAPHVLELIHQRPEARIVVSHLGNPQLDGDRLLHGREILALASSPNIYVQLSGLSMFCEYPHAPLVDFISEVVARFGPARITWGSNFPVCGDQRAYGRDLALARSGAWGLSAKAVQQVTGETARRLWFE